MKKIYVLLFTIVLFFGANAQVTVTVTNETNTTPALATSYTSLANALAALNATTAMTGPVTLTLSAGTETTPPTGLTIGSATLNPVLSPANTVTIINTGATAILNAGVGTATPGSAAPDGILKIVGADYITVDGLTLTDGNAANPATMEFGLALFKASLSDGAQNNIIKNCIINMQRINNASGTAPMVEGAVGILVINSIPTAATTSLSPTAAAGTNSFNKFYTNQINGGNYGIALSGFAALTPFATGDAANDIGGLSAVTGNTILNFGGAAAAANPAAGIRANNQFGGLNISYNIVNNNNGSGVNHVSTLRGIYAQAGTSASATINNNTVSIQSGATTSGCNAIENALGSTAATNTININNNVINVGYPTATTGVYNAIVNSSTATTVNINGNTISQISGVALGGTGTHVMIETGSPGTANTNNNTLSNIVRNGASGSWRGIKSTTPTVAWNCNNNTVDGLSWSLTTSTGSLDAIYDLSAATAVNIGTNIVRNLSTPTTGTINGININTVTGTHTCTNNTVYNFTTTSGGAGGATFTGIVFSVGNVTMSGNTIYSLNSTGTTGGVGGVITGIRQAGGTTNNIFKNKIYDLSTTSTGPTVYGINASGGTTNNIYNNLIGDLRSPAANIANAIRGIDIASTNANVYYNTVYLNASSTGALFGTSAINASTATNIVMRNNIFVNKSSFVGATGFSVAHRRSSTTLTSYAAASNNNLFFAGTPSANNLIFYDGTNSDQTLAAYKTRVASRDAGSISEDPDFVSTTGASATFLHINTLTPTQIESGGTAVAGITDDYDADVRNVSTPDIGADEFAGTGLDLTAPTITYTPLGFTCATGNRTLTATITDPSGVPTSGLGLPVLYWKINAGSYSAATGTFVSGNTYSFSFGAGVTIGDVLSYYIVAQDNAGTPNVGASPSAGAAGFTANPPAATTPPTTPSTYSINNSLSGSYTVGSGGNYPTITAAFAAYNTSCLSGPVVFNLTDAAYTTTSDTLRANPDASAINTLTIKPLGNTTITGNTTAGVIVLFGADYVTIDGSRSSSPNTICPLNVSSRELTITNSNVSTASAIVWLTHNGTDGANNNSVINCNIVGQASATTLIGLGSGSTIGSIATTANNNSNSYINNNISKLQIGLYCGGISSASKDQNTIINQNLINTVAPNNVSRGGISAFAQNNINVNGNNVSEMNLTTGTNDAFGITLGTLGISTSTVSTTVECTNARVSYNQIGSVRQTNTYSAFGIYVASGAVGTSEISNNMVRGVSANGTSGDFSVGIFVNPADGSTTKIYYNTVSMSGTQTGGSDKSYALAIAGGTAPTVDVKNNILINKLNNGTGVNYAYGLGYSAFTNITSDYNDLFTTAGALYSVGATASISTPTNQVTFAAFQAATAKDANSKNVDAVFVSSTNLHLDPSANATLNAGATPLLISNDIDCETRDISTPDIGADEFVYAAPSCAVPTSVTAGSITATGATVSWTGPVGTYILEYGLSGFTPGTTNIAGTGGTIINPATSPQGITGLSNGTTYSVYVRQDCTGSALGYSSNSSAVNFTTLVPPPANDDCITATPIPCGGSINGNTTAATNDALDAITCGSTTTTIGTNRGVWFTVTPTTSGALTVSTCTGTAFDTYIRAYAGACGAFTACAGSDDDGCTETTFGLSSLTFTATGGTTYYILMGGYSAADFGAYTISVTCPPACGVPTAVSTNAVTSSSVNVTWTGSTTSIVEYGLTGFTPGTGATAGAGGTVINPATSPQAITGLTPSTAYQVYVRQDCTGSSAGYSTNSSVVSFTTLATPPVNDAATGAIILTVGGGCTTNPYNNTNATQSVGEPYPSCKGTAGYAGMWYSFVAPASGTVKISCDGTGTLGDSRMALYSASNPADYTTFSIIACDDDNGITGTTRSLFYAAGLTGGTTYYINVDLYSSGSTRGTYCVTVDELAVSMLATTAGDCVSDQSSVGSYNTTYTGWVSLVDGAGNINANVRQTAGTAAGFSSSATIKTGTARTVNGVPYMNRNFLVNGTGATSADLQLFFTDAELTNLGSSLANLQVSRVPGTTCNANFTGLDAVLSQTASGSANGASFIQVTTPGFSNFYLRGIGGVLPVSIEFFRGSKQATSNVLDWKVTCTTEPSLAMSLERSADGRSFTSIQDQTATNARCLQGFNYVDATPLAGYNYYRLKTVTLDGKVKYSTIVVLLNKDKGFELISIAPNPVQNTAILSLTTVKGGRIELSVSDVAGKVISKQSNIVIAGNNPINMNFASLSAGTYIITAVNADGEIKTTRFVKL